MLFIYYIRATIINYNVTYYNIYILTLLTRYLNFIKIFNINYKNIIYIISYGRKYAFCVKKSIFLPALEVSTSPRNMFGLLFYCESSKRLLPYRWVPIYIIYNIIYNRYIVVTVYSLLLIFFI